MSEHFPVQPNQLHISLIHPGKRAFYSKGAGNPSPFIGEPATIKRGRSHELESISYEELSDRVLREPEYGFLPTKVLRALPPIGGTDSIVRTPVILDLSHFDRSVNNTAARLYNFDEVVETAGRRKNYIDPIHLEILTRAFENNMRRRTVIDLSA